MYVGFELFFWRRMLVAEKANTSLGTGTVSLPKPGPSALDMRSKTSNSRKPSLQTVFLGTIVLGAENSTEPLANH